MRQPTPLDDYLFDLQGYLVLENALDADLLDELNAQFDRFPHDLPRAAWYQGAQRHEVSATSLELHNCIEIGGPFETLIDHPSWLGYVEKYCGEYESYVAGLFIDECFASIRESGGYCVLHSGRFQCPLRTRYDYEDGLFRCGQINILMALDDIGEGDGGTIVIPGSHKSNLPLPVMGEYSPGGAKESLLPPAAVEVVLKKGDALLFVDAITHGASNRTNPGQRRVVIYRYGPSWARTRMGYEYSDALLNRLTPQRRLILQPVPKCRPGDDFVPVEAPVVARRAGVKE